MREDNELVQDSSSNLCVSALYKYQVGSWTCTSTQTSMEGLIKGTHDSIQGRHDYCRQAQRWVLTVAQALCIISVY